MTNTPPEFTPDLNVGDDRLQPFDVREREGWNPMIKLALVAAGLLIAAFIVMKLYTPGVRDRSSIYRIRAFITEPVSQDFPTSRRQMRFVRPSRPQTKLAL